MKITMTRLTLVANQVVSKPHDRYQKGETYDINDTLALRLIKSGYAYDASKPKPKEVAKADEAPLINKADLAGAQNNKGA